MPDTPNMEELAQRYMNLWQEHLDTLAGDQDTTKVVAQTMAMMSFAAQAFVNATSASVWPTQETQDEDTSDQPPSNAASDGDAAPDVAEFGRRLAALEKRVAKLESETAGSGSTSSKGRRKNKS